MLLQVISCCLSWLLSTAFLGNCIHTTASISLNPIMPPRSIFWAQIFCPLDWYSQLSTGYLYLYVHGFFKHSRSRESFPFHTCPFLCVPHLCKWFHYPPSCQVRNLDLSLTFQSPLLLKSNQSPSIVLSPIKTPFQLSLSLPFHCFYPD